MKIVILLPGLQFGGAERVCSILANEFVKRNHQVSFILTSSTECVYDLDPGVKVRGLYPISRKNPLSLFKHLWGMRQQINDLKPDIVLSFMDVLAVIAKVSCVGLKFKVVQSERNDPSHHNLSFIRKLMQSLTENIADGYVFQSDGAKALYPMRVQEHSKVILNPLNFKDMPVFEPGETRKNKIVSVGRLEFQKNQELLLKAFGEICHEFDDLSLHIYGEGSLRNKLQNLAGELGIGNKVVLEGNKREVWTHIYDASLFVFTSDFEGLPNALIEAMALGVPTVSTDCSPGGARMLIEDGVNGRLVPTGDVKALSQAMRELLNNSAETEMMAMRAKEIKHLVETDKIVDEWLAFMNEIIG